jgi:hypothetical protein
VSESGDKKISIDIECVESGFFGSSQLVLDKRLPPRRGYEVRPAIDPHDGGQWDIRFNIEELARRRISSRGRLLEIAHVATEVLLFPAAIFQGLRGEREESWICYSGKPTKAYRSDGSQRAPNPSEVHLVFVNAERVAYDYRWEHMDMDYPGRPVGWRTRFTRIWLP